MKLFQLLLLTTCLLGRTINSVGQSLPDAQHVNGLKLYIATVYKNAGPPGQKSIKGCLYAISDSSLTLVSPYGLKQDLLEGKPLDLTIIPLSAIEHVSVTRKGKVGTGMLVGVGMGSLVGLIASSGGGSSGGMNFTFFQGAMPFVLLGGTGAFIGTIFGVAPNRVVSHPSDKEKWKSLDRYTIETQLKKPPRGVTVSYEPTTY